MGIEIDPAIVALFGSKTRAAALAVLANADGSLTGYRVAKVTGIPEIKIYRELRRGMQAGLVRKDVNGFFLVDLDVRQLLRKRVRLFWSGAWYARETERAAKARQLVAADDSWLVSRKYRPNPRVAARYAREFARPLEKGPSRKSQ